MVSPELSEIGMVSRELSELSLSPKLSLYIWSPLQVPSLELESKLAASVEPGYNSPSRVRDSDLASDGTSQTGEAAAGFVQRPAIPPRPRRVTSRSPLEITAEYRAIVSPTVEKSVRSAPISMPTQAVGLSSRQPMAANWS